MNKNKKSFLYLSAIFFLMIILWPSTSLAAEGDECGKTMSDGQKMGFCINKANSSSSLNCIEYGIVSGSCADDEVCCHRANKWAEETSGSALGTGGTGTYLGTGGTGSSLGTGGTGTGTSSSTASTGGIVPCGKSGGKPCTICHLIQGIQNLVNWGKSILITVAIVGIVIAGLIYMMSSGSEAMITTAKNCFKASIVGFAITLAAWLAINTILLTILTASSNEVGTVVGKWNVITCDTTSSATTSSGTSGTSSGQTASQIASNLADCKKECSSSSKTSTELTTCNAKCESDAKTAASSSSGTGNSSVVSAAQQMKTDGCAYSQTLRNDCATDPKYTDCGQLACDAFKKSGNTSLGDCSSINTATLYSKAETYSGNTSDLKAGDIIVRNDGSSGHAAICEQDGCSTITHAAGAEKGIVTGANNYMLKQDIKVIKASST
ncbi:MAG: pilin [Parcubacteria group bacterium]|jgi:hypothetical protein